MTTIGRATYGLLADLLCSAMIFVSLPVFVIIINTLKLALCMLGIAYANSLILFLKNEEENTMYNKSFEITIYYKNITLACKELKEQIFLYPYSSSIQHLHYTNTVLS